LIREGARSRLDYDHPAVPPDLAHLALAVGLGLLVGLQREWAKRDVAGIRTFTMISVLGAVCALLSRSAGGWVIAAGFIAVAATLAVGNLLRGKSKDTDFGMTTEVAALVMFGVGAGLLSGFVQECIVVGGATAVLLHWKEPLHALVRRMGERDLTSIFRLVLIALVILPLLPDRTFGPYDVLNPFRTWLMVVLIVGIGLGAYVVRKLITAPIGIVVAGVLGGLVSSTATTLSEARRARAGTGGDHGAAAAVIIVIASTMMFARVVVEVLVVAPSTAAALLPPLAAMLGTFALIAAIMWLRARGAASRTLEDPAPSDLPAAIVFGLLYAVVLFGVAAAEEHFGDSGLYVVAAISGLHDMDAITLSTAELVQAGRIDVGIGWRLILVGALSNTLLKTMLATVIGGRALARRVVPAMLCGASVGIALLVLWPG
jgi:uncharacterized membrane protein (DUF4010 family)